MRILTVSKSNVKINFKYYKFGPAMNFYKTNSQRNGPLIIASFSISDKPYSYSFSSNSATTGVEHGSRFSNTDSFKTGNTYGNDDADFVKSSIQQSIQHVADISPR